MILDLKVPTLVIVGTWNTPIFTPPWLAQYIFGYAPGTEAPLMQILATAPNEIPRQVLYLKNQGFGADIGRINLYANSDGQGFTRLEQLATRFLATLPH